MKQLESTKNVSRTLIINHYHTIQTFNDREKENIMGKGENAGYQHFLLFLQCFLPFPKQISVFQSHLSSSNALNLDQAKIYHLAKS